jgi:hypothetical protein
MSGAAACAISPTPNGWPCCSTANTRRFQSRLRAARLRHSQASIEDIDYRTPRRRLDKALFQQLATCRWIAERDEALRTA